MAKNVFAIYIGTYNVKSALQYAYLLLTTYTDTATTTKIKNKALKSDTRMVFCGPQKSSGRAAKKYFKYIYLRCTEYNNVYRIKSCLLHPSPLKTCLEHV